VFWDESGASLLPVTHQTWAPPVQLEASVDGRRDLLRVGCRYSDRAHELGVRIDLGLPPRRLRGGCSGDATVLPRPAYPTVCRSIQLPAQLGRGDAAKDLEILVLPHQPSQE
jgi:hypothetical protein